MYVIAGGVGISLSGAAVGAAIAYNFMGGSFDPANPEDASEEDSNAQDSMTAYIDGSAVTASGNISVTVGFAPPASTPNPTGALDVTTFTLPSTPGQLVSVTVAGAGGDDFALGAGVSLDYIRDTDDAHISNTPAGKSVSAGGQVFVLASDGSQIDSGAGGFAGSGTAAVGAAVATNNIDNTVKAYIEDATVSSSSTSTGSTSPAIDVNAATTSTIINATVGGAGAGSVAIGGSVSVNDISDTTEAYISAGSHVTAPGEIDEAGSDQSVIAVLAGNIAGAGTVAAAAAVATNNVSNTVKGYIDGSTVTSSDASVNVTATSAPPPGLPPGLTAQINALAIGGAGAGDAALAGSLSLNWVLDTVEAQISGGSTVSGTSVSVTASDSSSITAIAGAIAGAGTVGIGASIAYNYIGGNTGNQTPSNPDNVTPQTNAVLAEIDSSKVTANTGDVDVDATDTAIIETLTIGGAGAGTFSFGGSLSYNVIKDSLTAQVSGTAIVSAPSGNVSIQATDEAVIDSASGGIAGAGGAAVGLGGSTNNIEDLVEADINAATVTAGGSIAVAATFTRPASLPLGLTGSINTLAIGGAIAGGVSLGGAVDLNTIDNTVTAKILGDAVVTAGTTLSITASQDQVVNPIAGSGSGALVASIGASVATVDLGNTTTAGVGDGASLSAVGALTVQATYTPSVTVDCYAGGVGGILAAQAQFAQIDDTSTESASIGDTQGTQQDHATVTQAGSLTVNATATRNLDAEAVGGTLGAIAVGAAWAQATAGGSTAATIGSYAAIGQAAGKSVGSISVGAGSNDTVTSNVKALAVGIGAGSYNDAETTSDPTITTSVGNNAQVSATGDIDIGSTFTAAATSTTTGVDAALAASVGYSVAKATLGSGNGDDVTTSVGNNATLGAGGNLSITAAATNQVPSATGTASTGAALAAFGFTTATATNQTTVQTTVGNSSTLTAAGNITVSSNNETSGASSSTNNNTGGLIADSSPTSTTTINDASTASLGTGDTVTTDRRRRHRHDPGHLQRIPMTRPPRGPAAAGSSRWRARRRP